MSCLDAICVPPVLHKIQALPRSFDFPPPPTVNCFSLRMMIVIKEYEDKYNFVRDDVVFNYEEDEDADIYIMMQCLFVCNEKSSLPPGSLL